MCKAWQGNRFAGGCASHTRNAVGYMSLKGLGIFNVPRFWGVAFGPKKTRSQAA